MEVLHQAEEPRAGIRARLLEALPRCATGLLADCVAADARDAELLLLGREPPGLGRVVGEQEEAEASHERGDAAFDDEEPENQHYVSGRAAWKLRMESYHCHPARPLTWSRVANVAAAIKPEHPVLRTCPVYSRAILVASSLRV